MGAAEIEILFHARYEEAFGLVLGEGRGANDLARFVIREHESSATNRQVLGQHRRASSHPATWLSQAAGFRFNFGEVTCEF